MAGYSANACVGSGEAGAGQENRIETLEYLARKHGWSRCHPSLAGERRDADRAIC